MAQPQKQPSKKNVSLTIYADITTRSEAISTARQLIASDDVFFKYRNAQPSKNLLALGKANLGHVEEAWKKSNTDVLHYPGGIAAGTKQSQYPSTLNVFEVKNTANHSLLPQGGYIKIYFSRIDPRIVAFYSFHA